MNQILLIIIFLLAGERPGIPVFPLLQLAQGPRGAALGEALTAVADDATALYWNTARLGKIRDNSISLSHQTWFDHSHDELFHLALPSNYGTFGMGFLYSATSGIEFWDEENQPGKTFTTWNGVLTLGYGLPIAERYFLGAGLKGCYENLYTGAGYGAGLDFGFAAEPFPSLKSGLTLRNLGLMKYNFVETLPAEIALGIAYSGKKFNIMFDGVQPYYHRPHLRVGLEYHPVNELNLRLGYRTGPQNLEELGVLSGITAGIGINLPSFALDYSLSSYGRLGLGHRIGIRLQLLRKGKGSLRIRVIDAETQKPLWANIKLNGVREYSGETNRIGELLLGELPQGRIIIHTHRQDYISRTDTMLILGDREQSAVITLSPVQYSTITGTLYDASTSKPVPGTITYKGPVYGELETDPYLGIYTIRSIPSGTYIISVQPIAPYISQTCTLELAPSQLTQKDFYLSK